MFKKIVVALNGSPEALAALEPARTLADKFGAEMHLVSVEYPRSPQGQEWKLTQAAYLDKKKQELQDYLDHWAEKLGRNGRKISTAVLPLGSPVSRLVDELTASGADLLVLYSHGRSGLSRLFFGSTAEELNRLASCPILVVHPLEESLQQPPGPPNPG